MISSNGKVFIVTSIVINNCNSILFGGSILEKVLSGKIRTKFERKASFLTEELDLWYHGGIDDISMSVEQKWNYLVYYIKNGYNRSTNENFTDQFCCLIIRF